MENELNSLKIEFNLSSEELEYKWDAYACNNLITTEIKENHLVGFKQYLSKNLIKNTQKTPKKETELKIKSKRFEEMTSPMLGSSAHSPGLIQPKIKQIYNEHIPKYTNTQSTVQFSIVSHQEIKPYRYMNDKLLQSSDFIDYRLSLFTNLIGKQLYEHEEELPDYQLMFSYPKHVSNQPLYYIGRITTDAITATTSLNTKSVFLESNREYGGERVFLDLSAVQSNFDLFPGMIIAVKGTNPTGDTIHVSEVISAPEMDTAVVSGDEYKSFYRENSQVDLLVCAGPYTGSDLSYRGLASIVELVESSPPDALILMGPIVDPRHPKFTTEDVDDTTVFRELVSPMLKRIKNAKNGLQLIILPALSDLDPYLAVPQPPLGTSIKNNGYDPELLEELGLGDSNGPFFNLVSNPALFTLNEIVVAATSVDAVGEVFRRQTSRENMTTRIALSMKHLIDQRSFFPVDPPTDQTRVAKFVQYSVNNNNNETFPGLEWNVKPNLILLPCMTGPAFYELGDVVCVSPGQVIKGNAGGTCARIYIQGLVTDEMDDNDVFAAGIVGRSRVEIIKLS